MAAVITPSICYRDPKGAAAWLCDAFGFTLTVAIESPDGDPLRSHYEVSPDGDAAIAVSGRWSDWTCSPADLDGASTQWLAVALPVELGAAGLNAHCERARAAGATITQDPADEFFGARRYRAIDPEGHHWAFTVHLRDVSHAEAEAAIGAPIARWG
ncbi:MAG: VOC family protein [Gordonia sp. (in: high G+C Gram-positive bacteria)]|uniref:VOC family protein n=1 Tax=Gordonia sp. (in: high G+C Gram-positive bacteria) TaxID=84139 RepID=UPI003BB50B25